MSGYPTNFAPMGYHTTLLWAMPGGTELIIIGFGILLFFGGRKIPEMMRGLGKGVREFKEAKDGAAEAAKPEKTQAE